MVQQLLLHVSLAHRRVEATHSGLAASGQLLSGRELALTVLLREVLARSNDELHALGHQLSRELRVLPLDLACPSL